MGGGGGGGAFSGTMGSRSNSTIHQGRQDKHIVGTNNYNRQIADGKNPSILTENASKLLREGVGKGQSYGNKEVVDYGRTIGKFYDTKSGQYYDTTRATIHYDSKGYVHIVPAAPRGFKR